MRHDLEGKGVNLLRNTFPSLRQAEAVCDKFADKYPQLCDDLLDWNVDLDNFNGTRFIHLIMGIDVSGSEAGNEALMTSAINKIVNKVASGLLANFTFCTIILFNNNVVVGAKMAPLLQMPMITTEDIAQPGDIVYRPDDATDLSCALIAGLWQKMVVGDYAFLAGYVERTILVYLTDGGHNRGIFAEGEVMAMIEAATAQYGKLHKGLVSIGDEGIPGYAKRIGLQPGDVWVVDQTDETLDEMVNKVSSMVVYHSTHVVQEGSGFFDPNTDTFSEPFPSWEEPGQG